MRSIDVLAVGMVSVVLAATSAAQSFNIDISSSQQGPGPTLPTTGYQAATGVGGVWNKVDETQSTFALVDVTGAATTATMGLPANAGLDVWFDLSGDVGRIFNDYQVIGWGHPNTTWSIQGIANGDYRVTFYSRPIDAYHESGVTRFAVTGGTSGPQDCDSSVFPGFNGYRYGLNMVQDTVTVTNNTLSWFVSLAGGTLGSFNGVQVELLVPGAVHTYCKPKQNSLGCTPVISSSGTPSISGGAFTVTAANVRSHHQGFLVWSTRQNGMPFVNGTGFLCVARPFTRTSAQDSGGASAADDCTGTYSFTFDTSYLALHGLTAGTSVPCQYWSVDENAPGGYGTTKGLMFVLAP